MELLRYTAFSRSRDGGNPAGVVLDARGCDSEAMLAIAREVGFSETAFLFPVANAEFVARYFSPRAEVPFCGHATIAAAVAYAERHGTGALTLHTQSGRVTVTTQRSPDGTLAATLTSVPPRVADLPEQDLAALLRSLRWTAAELDPRLPPRVAFAGAWHPILAASEPTRLAELDYDFDALTTLMDARGWTTVDLVWRASDHIFHCRNPFPPGGVVEDPATGAAAAAFGGYLRHLALLPTPTTISVLQGADLDRPSQLSVHIPADPRTGISVTGNAVSLVDTGERLSAETGPPASHNDTHTSSHNHTTTTTTKRSK